MGWLRGWSKCALIGEKLSGRSPFLFEYVWYLWSSPITSPWVSQKLRDNYLPLKTKALFWKAGLFELKDGQPYLIPLLACLWMKPRVTYWPPGSLQLTFCLQPWQNSSLKWPLSITGIFQKCIETVHPRKCDFTVSKTFHLVIKRLNTCCLFFLATVISFYIALLKLSKMKSLQDFEWFCFDFHLEDYCFIFKKKPYNCFSVFLTIISKSPVCTGPGDCPKYTSQEDSFFRQKKEWFGFGF